ncbi:MAG: (d)CMP kinase [Elusimicrobia bacterium]|nr:(d)CMP kinase [Elusimicrobiota bacterium]
MASRKRRGKVIAIDGPAGVGKSTIGTLVAKELGYRFINTGEMYRALTWKALEAGVDTRDAAALTRLANTVSWDFKTNEDGVIIRTVIDGEPVTTQIREERVGMNSSLVAGVPGVRKKLRALQRGLGDEGAIVMEGRDITTVVFPDADLKVYLDASIDERARRRTKQLRASGKKADPVRIKESIVQRDMQDLQRRINPLRQAEDAVVIDSTTLTMQEVAGRILELVRGGGSAGR